MAGLTFDYAVWLARFPELADAVDEATAQLYWDEAGLYWRNDGTGYGSELPDAQQRLLLNLVTAHIAGLNAAISGALPYNVVGRIGSASEGSVSVSAQLSLSPGNDLREWFAQTRWGFQFWAATAAYRLARYRAGPRRIFDPAAAAIYGRTGPFW